MNNKKTPRLIAPLTTPTYVDNKVFKVPFSKNLINHYVYMWLDNGKEFWTFPTKSNGDHIDCYIATEKNIWEYRRIEKNMIDSIF